MKKINTGSRDPSPGWWEMRHAAKLAEIAASGGDKVVWCDFNGRFLNLDGTFPKGMMMGDNLHPLEPGYAIWAEAVAPLFKEICGK